METGVAWCIDPGALYAGAVAENQVWFVTSNVCMNDPEGTMRLFSVGFFLVGCLTCFAQVKQPVLVLSQVDSLRSTFSGVRGEDLSKLDLRTVDLFGITFDSFTEWPSRERLPVNFDPEEILEWGKAPGLGVGDLHAKGITGKGVHVAIVDQPLLTNHVEYAHQLVLCLASRLINCEPTDARFATQIMKLVHRTY